MHSALREMQRHFSDPRVLGGMLVIAAMLGLAGPFGTFEALPTLPRLAYWTAIVFVTYGLGYGTGAVLGPPLRRRLPHPALRVPVLGAAAGIPIAAAVIALNAALFGAETTTLPGAASLLIYCVLIAIGINAIFALLEQRAAPDPAAQRAAAAPPILERLPLPQRGQLLSLSVADHYVEVTTDRGRALLLLRLSDAIRETAGTAGLQIHRSHWVALQAVAGVVRSGGKPMVELRDGRRLPISRSYRGAARAAGLLP